VGCCLGSSRLGPGLGDRMKPWRPVNCQDGPRAGSFLAAQFDVQAAAAGTAGQRCEPVVLHAKSVASLPSSCRIRRRSGSATNEGYRLPGTRQIATNMPRGSSRPLRIPKRLGGFGQRRQGVRLEGPMAAAERVERLEVDASNLT